MDLDQMLDLITAIDNDDVLNAVVTLRNSGEDINKVHDALRDEGFEPSIIESDGLPILTFSMGPRRELQLKLTLLAKVVGEVVQKNRELSDKKKVKKLAEYAKEMASLLEMMAALPTDRYALPWDTNWSRGLPHYGVTG